MPPASDPGHERARALALELLEAEASAGFPLLGRVPSSSVRRFLDYYAELPEDEAAELRQTLAERGALALRPAAAFTRSPGAPGLPPPPTPAYERWTTAMLSPRFAGVRNQPLRLAKNLLGSGLGGLPEDEAARLAATKGASAGGLRKLIGPLLADRFGLTGANRGGGDWRYAGGDGTLTVALDFGGRSDQLRYWVTAVDPASGTKIPTAAYEGVLGLFGGWDWIVEEDAQAAAELLAELVGLLAGLPGRLAA